MGRPWLAGEFTLKSIQSNLECWFFVVEKGCTLDSGRLDGAFLSSSRGIAKLSRGRSGKKSLAHSPTLERAP